MPLTDDAHDASTTGCSRCGSPPPRTSLPRTLPLTRRRAACLVFIDVIGAIIISPFNYFWGFLRYVTVFGFKQKFWRAPKK